MQPADLQNRRTHEARHNEKPIDVVLAVFREARMRMVQRLESLPDSALTTTALHPRLAQPMTIVDLSFFVAEHDDHHLARITQLIAYQR